MEQAALRAGLGTPEPLTVGFVAEETPDLAT